MPSCPQCHQPTDTQSIRCPHCNLVLKAYGHPGITLHRAKAGESLCTQCTYHLDDTCNFPQRPTARECTLYQPMSTLDSGANLMAAPPQFDGTWFRTNLVWFILAGLLLLSLLIALT